MMFQERMDCDERVVRRDSESEKVRDATKAEVLPIRVGCSGNGF